eukprot:GDKI01011837.1.p1 GENE.GDKI01011837.1~~GDKI01011837.1.p1  ORF type:complete len:344 (-),score=125.48 GDKI01011837.1:383-1414(-)
MYDDSELPGVMPTKSYKNQDWLNSRAARHVRIQCEYLETQDRLRRHGIHATILFFGSARAFNQKQYERELSSAEKALHEASDDAAKEVAQQKFTRVKAVEWLIPYWEKTRELAKKLTAWSMTSEAKKCIWDVLDEIDDPVDDRWHHSGKHESQRDITEASPSPLIVCTGGGPGMMEAANKGAYEVPGARSMGMGISLPFEPGLNPYVTPDLGFEYHYFFTRKFWMVYCTLALVCTPGGLGTLDELMEVLTLKQCGKIKRPIPIVLLGKSYWKDVINFDKLVEYGTIAARDRDSLFWTDSVDEAFEHIVSSFTSGRMLMHKNRAPGTEPEETGAAGFVDAAHDK